MIPIRPAESRLELINRLVAVPNRVWYYTDMGYKHAPHSQQRPCSNIDRAMSIVFILLLTLSGTNMSYAARIPNLSVTDGSMTGHSTNNNVYWKGLSTLHLASCISISKPNGRGVFTDLWANSPHNAAHLQTGRSKRSAKNCWWNVQTTVPAPTSGPWNQSVKTCVDRPYRPDVCSRTDIRKIS